MKNKFNLDASRQYFSKIKTWVLIVVVLAVIIGGYYSVLGVRFWNSSKELPELRDQSNTLLRTLRNEGVEERTVELELNRETRSLDAVRELFTYPETDELIDILADTAEASNVILTSALVGERLTKVQDGIQYQTQPIGVSVQARPDTIFRWLEVLHSTVPVTGVPSFRISNLDSTPTARIDFIFFLSPSSIDGKGE